MMDSNLENLDIDMDVWHDILCLELTQHCNWKCTYCECKVTPPFRHIEYFEFLKQHILPEARSKYKGVNLTGGEPGLLSQEDMDYIFEYFQGTINYVFTNGLFIEKGYDKRYRGKYNSLYYHCVEELSDNIIHTNLDNATYTIVVHQQNTHMLDGFLSRYRDINFMLSFPNFSNIIEDDTFKITKDRALCIIEICLKNKNVSNSINEMLKLYSNKMEGALRKIHEDYKYFDTNT